MIYLERFTFPDDGREFDYILGVKLKCYTSFYPFKVLSARGLKRLDFEPVTILYGGNGSGKSTALHVIAEKAGLARGAPFNRTSFFDDYVALCGMEARAIPPGASSSPATTSLTACSRFARSTTASTANARMCLRNTWRRSSAMCA